jgi:2-polyprenyl-3-methyl-5-hydroxy-6-metoxy-1,4-benzoquinol methylase
MSANACSLCGSRNSEPVVKERGYQAVRCVSCGLIYLEAPPSQIELQQLYEAGNTASLEVDAQMQLRAHKLLVAAKDLDRIQRYVRSGTLLEVGCGAGYFLAAARRRGFDVKGLELNNRLVEFGRKQLAVDILQGSLSQVQLPRKYYDVIYMRNVLSHLSTPVQDFRIISQLLSKGGYFFMETGNGAELGPQKLELLKRKNLLGIPDHLFFFSQQNIEFLAAAANLQIVACTRYSMVLYDQIMQRAGHRMRLSLQSSYTRSPRSRWKEKLAALSSYFLIYTLGRFLPTTGQHCTLRYICRKTAAE